MEAETLMTAGAPGALGPRRQYNTPAAHQQIPQNEIWNNTMLCKQNI
jgi:hypothetical protein